MKIKNNLLNNYLEESKLFTQRIIISSIAIFFLTVFLVIYLYFLQIKCFNNYYYRSNNNCIKIIPIMANRGTIYDRNGIPIALNRTTYQLNLLQDNKKTNNLKKTINNLRSIINLTNSDIINFKKIYNNSHNFFLTLLKTNLTEIQKARFAINHYRFPNVELKKYQYRYYPYGATLTHVIGYITRINNNYPEKLNIKKKISNYTFIYQHGKSGVEHYYEHVLNGIAGYKKVEVNNYGFIVRYLQNKPPRAGHDIKLTLDLKLQQYIEKLLIGNRAAVVVVDPRDGAILSLVSYPSYDPNLFVTGISNKKYHELLLDKNYPFFNRVTQGVYPPASTVKPYISVSALDLGIINKKSSLFDFGYWKLPNSNKQYYDWKKQGHGYLNITKALEESADTFFYQIANDIGIDRLSEWMFKFGYGKHTGIDLFEEHSGIMPTRNWKMKRFKKPWYKGDTIPVGIGQGYWTATPIQMSKALMILINNGTVRTPHLLHSVIKKNGQHIFYNQLKHIQIGNPKSDYWKIVKNGMYGVANRTNGTAYKNFMDAPYKIAAKSGTAQLYSIKDHERYKINNIITEHLRDHKLMIAFAPYKKPTIGIVVILENGGTGITVGTITRKILDFILLKN